MDIELVRVALSILYLVTVVLAVFFIKIPDKNVPDNEVYKSLGKASLLCFILTLSSMLQVALVLYSDGYYSIFESNVSGIFGGAQFMMMFILFLELDLFVLRYQNANIILMNNGLKNNSVYVKPKKPIAFWLMALLSNLMLASLFLLHIHLYAMFVLWICFVFMFAKPLKEMIVFLVKNGDEDRFLK